MVEKKVEKKEVKWPIPNKDLLEEINLSKQNDVLTKRALEMLMLLILKLSEKFKYKYPQDREDCEAAAIEDVLRYWNRFNPEKSSNAFSYYTQMSKNGFAKGLRKLYPIKAGMKVSISKEYGIHNI